MAFFLFVKIWDLLEKNQKLKYTNFRVKGD